MQKQFTSDKINIDCCVIKMDHKFWFKAHNIAVFLGYNNPDQAVSSIVPPEQRKKWQEFESNVSDGFPVPSHLKPDTVLISESGFL
jgi:prophage antirepressor-like protein